MCRVRESWTDERLDDFRGEVNRRFDRADADRHATLIAGFAGVIATQL